MNTHQTITTQRLILRNFQETDIDAIYDIFSNQEVNQFLPWFPLQTKADAHQFYQDNYALQKSGYQYAICLKTNNSPIGYVHVSGDDSHDFGYGLKKEYWHQGIVTEACEAVIEQLKKDGFAYITATHDIHNLYSGKVMEKLKMTYQYSYQEQWLPKNILVTFRMYQLNFQDNIPIYQKYWNMYPHFIENIKKQSE